MKHTLRIDDLQVTSFSPQPEPEQPAQPVDANFQIAIGQQSCIGFWCPPEPLTGDTTLTV